MIQGRLALRGRKGRPESLESQDQPVPVETRAPPARRVPRVLTVSQELRVPRAPRVPRALPE